MRSKEEAEEGGKKKNPEGNQGEEKEKRLRRTFLRARAKSKRLEKIRIQEFLNKEKVKKTK